MATLPTIKELRSMQVKDLLSEIAEHANVLAKMRIDVALRSEKDTAKLRRLRRAIARMNTVLVEKSSSATVPAPAKSPKAK